MNIDNTYHNRQVVSIKNLLTYVLLSSKYMYGFIHYFPEQLASYTPQVYQTGNCNQKSKHIASSIPLKSENILQRVLQGHLTYHRGNLY